MAQDLRLLQLATAATSTWSPTKTIAALRAQGWHGLEPARADARPTAAELIDDTAASLLDRGIGVIAYSDAAYPAALTELPSPPPILFYQGNLSIFNGPAVGMCGSRHASQVGLNAARACGTAVARAGLTIVSGYARGVDMETHLAALDLGGTTVIVLAEGFMHFRVKKAFGDSFDPDRVLVLSQFAPRQPWHVGSAMTRNAVIAGLGRALVVIEANGSGGTLDAGLQALAVGRPVLALEFENGPTPDGNRVLIERGAIPVRRPSELTRTIGEMADPLGAAETLRLALI